MSAVRYRWGFSRSLTGPVALTSILAAGALLVVACGSTSTGETPSSGAPSPSSAESSAASEVPESAVAGDVTFWWWGEQEAPGLEAWVKETADEFMAQNPDVTVNPVLQATENLVPGFTSACQAQTGPGLQYMWGGSNTMQFVWRDCLKPVSSELSPETLSHVFPTNLDETKYKGEVWGLPWYTAPTVIAYNKELFEKAGLDPESFPTDLDGFLDASSKLNAAGIVPMSLGIRGLSGTGNFVSPWILQGLDNPVDILQPVVGAAAYTEPKYSGWMAALEQMITAGVFNPDVNARTYAEGQDLFLTGKAAMTVAIGTQTSQFQSALGDGLGVALPPKVAAGALAGKMPNTSQQLLITAFGESSAAAASFLNFSQTSDRLNRMVELSGAIPPNDQVSPDVIKLAQQREIVQWMANDATTNYQNYWPPQMDRENLFLAVQGMFAGDLTAEQAAAQVDSGLAAWREQNPADVEQLSDWSAGS